MFGVVGVFLFYSVLYVAAKLVSGRHRFLSEVVCLLPPLLKVIPATVSAVGQTPVLVFLSEVAVLEEEKFTCVDHFFQGSINLQSACTISRLLSVQTVFRWELMVPTLL